MDIRKEQNKEECSAPKEKERKEQAASLVVFTEFLHLNERKKRAELSLFWDWKDKLPLWVNLKIKILSILYQGK